MKLLLVDAKNIAKNVIINRPNIDVKNNEVSSESYSEAFLLYLI